MDPVPFYVSAGAERAQAANPDADLIDALRRGIESWNDVLGFRALEAVFVEDDEVRDDDASIFLVDYPGEGLGYAFANFRPNPNTGEVRGGSVYMRACSSTSPISRPEPESAALRPSMSEQRPLAVAEFVMRRVVLDPVELRGDITFDVSDPGVIALLIE